VSEVCGDKLNGMVGKMPAISEVRSARPPFAFFEKAGAKRQADLVKLAAAYSTPLTA